MIINLSEFLAILPYLLRSLRIQKVFEAREIYYITDEIPKKIIHKWSEERILKIFLPILFVVSGVVITCGMLMKTQNSVQNNIPNYFIPNYNTLSYPMINDGDFCIVNMKIGFTYMNFLISLVSFIEYILLAFALNAQWKIEKEYSIFREILLVSICWFSCNSFLNFLWATDKTISQFFTSFDDSENLTLNILRWTNFPIITLRSLLLITISGIHVLCQTFREDQLILIPEGEEILEQMETVLHSALAIEYFFDFLEYQEKGTNSKLLGLYTDIRFYDAEIKKVIEAESAIKMITQR